MTASAIAIGSARLPHEAAHPYEIGKLGMWLFFAGETMLFGGLMGAFVLLGISRGGWGLESAGVNWRLAAVNTVILFISSLMAALAHGAARVRDSTRARHCLEAAALFGILFLAIKGFEYAGDIRGGLAPSVNLFWSFYYLMTGIHVIHLLAGIVAMVGLALMMTPDTSAEWLERKLGYVCLYWYFVETVWVGLFALVYLAPRAK
jgi:heme/copper-type cytochrome/quinol oxidase subunit 3